MDFNEDAIKAEVTNLVSSLQRLLPKKKDVIFIEPIKKRLCRLSEVHAEAKGVFPKCFIGAELVVLRQVLDRVKLVQRYSYGTTKESYNNYKRYLNNEMKTKNADGLTLDTRGYATATYTEKIDGPYTVHLTSRIKDLIASDYEIELERDGDKSVGSFAFKMNDMETGTLRAVAQYLYQTHPDFSVGIEVGVKPLLQSPSPDLSISARYQKPSFALSSTVSKAGFQICAFKQLSHDLRIAAVLNEGLVTPVTAGLALHKSFGEGCDLKMFVDSQRCGGFTLERDVYFYESPNDVRMLRLVGSTLIDGQRRVRLGLGFSLDF